MKEYWKQALATSMLAILAGVAQLWQGKIAQWTIPTQSTAGIPTTNPPLSPTIETKLSEAAVELEFWKSAEKCGSEQCLKSYLARYPNGSFAPVANAHIGSLTVPVSNQKSKAAEPLLDNQQQVVANNFLPISAPTIKVGDSYVYENLDQAHPENNFATKRTVIANSDEIVLSNLTLNKQKAKARNLYYNHEWNLIRTRNPDGTGKDYLPPLKYYSFPLYPGKTWQQTTTETDIKTRKNRIHTITGVAEQWETITVPAGTFYAMRVNFSTQLYDPSTDKKTNSTDTSWYVPQVRRSVKSITTDEVGKKYVIHMLQYDLK